MFENEVISQLANQQRILREMRQINLTALINSLVKQNTEKTERVHQRARFISLQKEITNEYLNKHTEIKSKFYQIVKRKRLSLKVRQIEEQATRWKEKRDYYMKLMKKKEESLFDQYHSKILEETYMQSKRNSEEPRLRILSGDVCFNQFGNDFKYKNSIRIDQDGKRASSLKQEQNFPSKSVSNGYVTRLREIINKGFDNDIDKVSQKIKLIRDQYLKSKYPRYNSPEKTHFTLNELKLKLSNKFHVLKKQETNLMFAHEE